MKEKIKNVSKNRARRTKKRSKRIRLQDVPQQLNLDALEKFYESGLLDRQVALGLGVSERTLNRYKDAPGIKTVINGAREKWKNKSTLSATQALFRRVTGYNIAEVTMEPVLAMQQVGGVKERVALTRELRITKSIIKHIPGDVNAQLEWLYNNDPENWKRKFDPSNPLNEHITITHVVPAFSGNIIRAPK